MHRVVGDGQRGDEPLVGDPRVLLARVPRAGARDAGHVAGGRAHGAARLRVRRARRAEGQAGLHVHAHRRARHQLRARGRCHSSLISFPAWPSRSAGVFIRLFAAADRGVAAVPEDDGAERALAAGAAGA